MVVDSDAVSNKDKLTMAAAGLGFCIALFGVSHFWSSLVNRVEVLDQFRSELRKEYETDKIAIQQAVRLVESAVGNQKYEIDQLKYQVVQADTKNQAQADRMDKFMAFSNNQITELRKEIQQSQSEMRKDINSVMTQVEIANQILRRMEAVQNSDRNLTRQ